MIQTILRVAGALAIFCLLVAHNPGDPSDLWEDDKNNNTQSVDSGKSSSATDSSSN